MCGIGLLPGLSELAISSGVDGHDPSIPGNVTDATSIVLALTLAAKESV
ncbi:hypothetical protein [Bacillus pseudomycoides]